ncbi:hypothetical protein BJY01DRAFT_242833 [Aspergillus pseudoustus]|uniref:Methyltransferase type 11 domain-containing protein n=1 Tax=Aspergillus pseudoustus TaxID=1810923 RepID=A0ABR4KW49_9EURO
MDSKVNQVCRLTGFHVHENLDVDYDIEYTEVDRDSTAKYARERSILKAVLTLFDSFSRTEYRRWLRQATQSLRVKLPIQRYSVIVPVGTSPDRIAFGECSVDLILCANYSIEDRQSAFRALKDAAVGSGRSPNYLAIVTGWAVT